jgi:cell division protein FtsB
MVAKFKKDRKGDSFQSIFFSVAIGILVLGIIGFFVISNLRINQKRTQLTSQIESLRKEIQILEEKNVQLKAGISQTEEESYWEERLREQGYKKPGEEQVVVLPPEEKGEEKGEAEKTLWQKFLEKIGF